MEKFRRPAWKTRDFVAVAGQLGLTTAQQAEIAANGNLQIEVYMHNVYDDGGGLQDGWGGNIGIIALDSAPEVWSGRAADLALNPGGTFVDV